MYSKTWQVEKEKFSKHFKIRKHKKGRRHVKKQKDSK